MQFSGEPPAWYRSPGSGPRVRVYDGGTLVDDTQIRLSVEDDKSMRETAFRALQEEQQLEAIKRLERTARREESRRQQEERDAERAQTKTAEVSDTTESPPEVLPESLDPEMVERLKSIIADYDRAGDSAAIQTPEGSPPPATASTY